MPPGFTGYGEACVSFRSSLYAYLQASYQVKVLPPRPPLHKPSSAVASSTSTSTSTSSSKTVKRERDASGPGSSSSSDPLTSAGSNKKAKLDGPTAEASSAPGPALNPVEEKTANDAGQVLSTVVSSPPGSVGLVPKIPQTTAVAVGQFPSGSSQKQTSETSTKSHVISTADNLGMNNLGQPLPLSSAGSEAELTQVQPPKTVAHVTCPVDADGDVQM